MKALVRYLRERVPMTGHIEIRPGPVSAGSVELHAPLAPNVNDKGTAFAGSLASLCTLAGWAVVVLECRDSGMAVDVAATDARIRYVRPVTGPKIRAIGRRPDDGTRERFLSLLLERSSARLTVNAHIESDGRIAVRYRGTYVARRID